MPKRWIGVVVGSDKVVIVDAEVPSSGSLILQADETWRLQSGDRAAAYAVMYQQVLDYVKARKIDRVIIKESALSQRGTKKGHLEAAELRGVVMCAAASVAPTETMAKALISRTFGTRKVDEYVRDDAFWSAEVSGVDLRSGSREAAMALLAARKVK